MSETAERERAETNSVSERERVCVSESASVRERGGDRETTRERGCGREATERQRVCETDNTRERERERERASVRQC